MHYIHKALALKYNYAKVRSVEKSNEYIRQFRYTG